MSHAARSKAVFRFALPTLSTQSGAASSRPSGCDRVLSTRILSLGSPCDALSLDLPQAARLSFMRTESTWNVSLAVSGPACRLLAYPSEGDYFCSEQCWSTVDFLRQLEENQNDALQAGSA
jgi:hypothetical protein